MQAIQQRIKDFKKFKQIKDLETEFKTNLGKSFRSRHGYKNHFNSSFDYKEIKLPNIFLFDLKFSIRQWDEWFINLKQTFQRIKKKILKK